MDCVRGGEGKLILHPMNSFITWTASVGEFKKNLASGRGHLHESTPEKTLIKVS